MSYYFAIINTRDKPLFEVEFGTSKQGGDGAARFSPEARKMNPFIVHAALDYVDELQWSNNAMYVVQLLIPSPSANKHRYLKRVDHFASSHISTFLTPTSTRFMLLHLPHPPNQPPQNPAAGPTTYPPFSPYTSVPTAANVSSSSSSKMSSSSSPSTSIPNNPTSPQTEEAIKGFVGEVFECWCKAIMNPFQSVEQVIGSAVFRGRVVAAGKKYL